MVKVEFLGPIGVEPLSIDIKNLKELSNILKKNNEISSWLENCAVAVNDTLIMNKDYNLKDGDRISLLPPVCGG